MPNTERNNMSSSTTNQNEILVQGRPGKGFAITSLVLGILGVLFGFIPLFGMFLALPLGIIGLIFGLLGLLRARKAKVGKAMSIVGSVLSVLAIILAIVGFNAVNAALSPSTSSTPAASAAPAAPAVGVGATARDGQFEFVVTQAGTKTSSLGGSQFSSAKQAQGEFVAVKLRVKNVGNTAQSFSTGTQKALDASGRKYSADTSFEASQAGGGNVFTSVNPGNEVTGTVFFDVPKGTNLTAVELHDSPFSAGVRVNL